MPATIKYFTCQHCGKVRKVRPMMGCSGGARCGCTKVRSKRRDRVEEFQEYECIAIADHERTMLRNAPMTMDAAEHLLNLDALYEDMLCWNRRSSKCVAAKVPDECRGSNRDGTARREMKDIVLDGKISEDRPPGKPWPKKKKKHTAHRTEFPAALCKQCGRIFPKTRSDRVFCSMPCVLKSSYQKKKSNANT